MILAAGKSSSSVPRSKLFSDLGNRCSLLTHQWRPKRRHLVIAEFVEVCVEEGTLLDEDGKCLLHLGVEASTYCVRRVHVLNSAHEIVVV